MQIYIQYLAYILSIPILGYVRGGIWKRTHAFIRRHKTLIWCYFGALPVQPVSQNQPEEIKDAPKKFKIVLSTLLQPPVCSSIDPIPYFSEDLQSLPMFDE